MTITKDDVMNHLRNTLRDARALRDHIDENIRYLSDEIASVKRKEYDEWKKANSTQE
jgi:hypothetical protein